MMPLLLALQTITAERLRWIQWPPDMKAGQRSITIDHATTIAGYFRRAKAGTSFQRLLQATAVVELTIFAGRQPMTRLRERRALIESRHSPRDQFHRLACAQI